jgi:hypothetical protein
LGLNKDEKVVLKQVLVPQDDVNISWNDTTGAGRFFAPPILNPLFKFT